MRGETSLIRSGRQDPPRERLSLFSDAGSGAVSDWVSGVMSVGLSRDHLLPQFYGIVGTLDMSGSLKVEILFGLVLFYTTKESSFSVLLSTPPF